MRVLFVTTTYPLKPGDSIPSFVADLAQNLVRSHGVRVRVLAPHHAGAARRETVDGVEIERFRYALDPARQCVAYGGGIPDNLKNFPRAKWQLPGFFAAIAGAVWRHAGWADLIHAHWVEPAFLAMLANRGRRPLVCSVHSLRPKASRLHRFTLARVDRVLFNSQYTLSQARDKGYFPCKAQVVHQGYDDQLFPSPRLNESRIALGIPTDATLILTLGRMIEVKGFHVLAKVADRILENRPSAHLVFAGDGPQRPELESIVATQRSRGRIHFTGALPRDRVARLFADADLFVNPGVIDSTGRAEGFGITTIEAMASGLPAVGGNVGGIPETIVDGETGYLVTGGNEDELAAAVSKLVDDAALRKRMGDAARQRAKANFTWPVLAGKVFNVYQELLGRRGTTL